MKKYIIFLLFSLWAVCAFSQSGVKETSRIKKDSSGRIYRERTIVEQIPLPDTNILKFQIRQIEIELDTLKERRKRLLQDIKDWKKAKDNPPGAAPKNAPRSEDTAPATPISVPNPAANKPPVKEKKKKKSSSDTGWMQNWKRGPDTPFAAKSAG